jgi:hypothetical protein
LVWAEYYLIRIVKTPPVASIPKEKEWYRGSANLSLGKGQDGILYSCQHRLPAFNLINCIWTGRSVNKLYLLGSWEFWASLIVVSPCNWSCPLLEHWKLCPKRLLLERMALLEREALLWSECLCSPEFDIKRGGGL